VNLAQILSDRANEGPAKTGLIFEDGRSWTWGEWGDVSGKYASALRSLGIGKGDRIALFLQNSPQLVFALFGAWQIGAIPITISWLYNENELKECLLKTKPTLVVTVEDKANIIPTGYNVSLVGDSSKGQNLQTLAEKSTTLKEIENVANDDEAVILFTGGTSGLPKPVISTSQGIFAALETLARASKGGKPGPYPLAPQTVSPNLLCWPLFHGGGQHSLMFAIYVGRSVVLMERFRVATVGELVEKYQIDNLFLLPTMMYDLVHSDEKIDLTSVRQVLTAGQALDPVLRIEFEERFHVPILSNYGSTETGHIAGWSSKDFRDGNWKPGAAGHIYEGVELEIRGEDLSKLTAGEQGEIWVRTSMSKGYAGEVSEDDILIVDGWVRTGDIGSVDEDNVLFLAGRKRELIKCGGYQVWPGEIERELRQHPAIADVVVVGADDERLGEVPKAFVVLRENLNATAQEIIAFSRDRLAHFKQVRDVEFLDELPRTDAGKIQRQSLKNRQNKEK